MAPSRNATDVLVISNLPESCLHNAVKKKLPDGSYGYLIRDINYADYADPLSTDILLKFDREPDRYVKDDSGKYDIYAANYNFVKDGLGNGCAYFFKSDHEVSVHTSEGLWLGSTGDLGSFNIEFRFRAAELRGGSILFSRIGYFSGTKKGIEIKINEGRVSAYLYNMFRTPDGRLLSASLVKGGNISRGRWHHFSLSFDRASGRLSKFLDDSEEDVKYMTANGSAFSEVYTPMFGYVDAADDSNKGTDLPFAVIGRNFNGMIDEFRISYRHFHELKSSGDVALTKYKGKEYAGRIPYNREGVITSPVKEFPTTGTSVTEFIWDETLDPGTFIWMEFRISDRYFSDRDTTVKWYRINPGQKRIFTMKGEDGEFLRGKYFQWKAHLVASPEGNKSPVMKKVTISFRADRSPVAPLSLEVAETGNGYVILKWKKNVEADIAGYRIYYGTRKGVYDGIISLINGRKITNAISEGNYLSVKIDNSIIDENRAADARNVLLYPLIENTVLYYFAVSAYDSYREGTVYNHESDLSSAIQARPYAGSEIK